jgi:hypothetical protein
MPSWKTTQQRLQRTASDGLLHSFGVLALY